MKDQQSGLQSPNFVHDTFLKRKHMSEEQRIENLNN